MLPLPAQDVAALLAAMQGGSTLLEAVADAYPDDDPIPILRRLQEHHRMTFRTAKAALVMARKQVEKAAAIALSKR